MDRTMRGHWQTFMSSMNLTAEIVNKEKQQKLSALQAIYDSTEIGRSRFQRIVDRQRHLEQQFRATKKQEIARYDALIRKAIDGQKIRPRWKDAA